MVKKVYLLELDSGLLLINPHGNPLAKRFVDEEQLNELISNRAFFGLDELAEVSEYLRNKVQGRLFVNGIFPLWFVASLASPLVSLYIYDPKLKEYVDQQLRVHNVDEANDGFKVIKVWEWE